MEETERSGPVRIERGQSPEQLARKQVPSLPKNQDELNALIANVQAETLRGLGGFGNIIAIKQGYDELEAHGREISPQLKLEVTVEQDRRLTAFNASLGEAITAATRGPIELQEDATQESYFTAKPAVYETPKAPGHDERLAQRNAEQLALFQAIASGQITDLEQLASQEAAKSVENEEMIIALQEQAGDLQAQIEEMRYDPLFVKEQIFSKGEFLRRFPEMVAAANRADTPLGMIIFDADFFKVLNDTQGHPIGDSQLRLFAKALRETFRRQTDHLFRYGGEELIAVVEGLTAEQSVFLISQLQDIYRQYQNDMNYDDPSVDPNDMLVEEPYAEMAPQTFSAGVVLRPANVDGRPVVTHGDMLKQADQALYAAKRSGRNRAVIFGSEEYDQIIASNPPSTDHH